MIVEFVTGIVVVSIIAGITSMVNTHLRLKHKREMRSMEKKSQVDKMMLADEMDNVELVKNDDN